MFQVVSCSLQVVSGYFLLVLGRFRSFLPRCRSFQVVSHCFRLFQVVSCFSKYAKLLQNDAKFKQTITPGSKITWGIWQLQVSSGKSEKLKFDGLRLSKKGIPSAKTLYTKDLCNITFNYLCEHSPNSLCHFWNHKSFFTTQVVCIFLTQKLHTFDKCSSSKCKFSGFPLLELKFTKFLMSFFK